MWEMYDSDKKPREFSARFAGNKKCDLCKTFFRPEDKFYIIIIPNDLRGSHNRLKENMLVHVDEWNELCKGVTNNKEMAEKIIGTKFKKKNDLNEEESKRLDAFKQACILYDLKIEVSKSYGLRMRQRGSSLYADYNVFMDKIEIDYRGDKGLFDNFYRRQVIANLYNAMHAILNDGLHDDYNYEDSINNVLNEVNQNMKDIF